MVLLGGKMCGRFVGGHGLNVSSWFDGNMWVVVGDGVNSYVWLDSWVGVIPLRVRFNRLYELVENMMSTVADVSFRMRRGGETWKWQRRLCCDMLDNIFLQVNVVVKWQWLLDPLKVYSVNKTYQFLVVFDVPS